MIVTGASGTPIFWITIALISTLLTAATLTGRPVCRLLPVRLREQAVFYLAPAAGLAVLTIVASWIGRSMPLGGAATAALPVAGLVVTALLLEKRIVDALRHALAVSVFGVLCGASLLVPLFAYGAFDAHNDAFTYLVHSDWLQHHGFSEVIPPDQIAPATTQVVLYQRSGLRMGGSFLLALTQAIFRLDWSYFAYPAVVVASVAACCLSIGFPLARALVMVPRSVRLAYLALPAFGLGGLVFGSNYGFMPQTLGLALGACFMFLLGSTLAWLVKPDPPRAWVIAAGVPSAILLSAATLAYSELLPFLLAASVVSGLLLAIRNCAWKIISLHLGVLFGLTTILLNIELVRAYTVLRMQMGVVVGTPNEWHVIGYVGHAFGLHGGAWDDFQWANPGYIGSRSFIAGCALLCLFGIILCVNVRRLVRMTAGGVLMPTATILMTFASAFVYFRYFVRSPFQVGVGQSWSQFKISDWAHPFALALLMFAFASLRPRLGGRLFVGAVVAMFLTGVVVASTVGYARVLPLMRYYENVADLSRFYLKFRSAVLARCAPTAPVYLAMGELYDDKTFRHMAALFLLDREIRSDWRTDVYVLHDFLPHGRIAPEMSAQDCLIEVAGQSRGIRNSWMTVGRYRVSAGEGGE